MKSVYEYSEMFKANYEKFVIGCESTEETKMWDEEQYGDMLTYYDNDLVSIILQLISADGNISKTEVEKLNEIFGFSYECDELVDLYHACKENVDNMFANGISDAYTLLVEVNEKLAASYKELVKLVAEIVTECDGVVLNGEKDMALKLKDIMNSAE